MLHATLIKQFEEGLFQLKSELEAFPDEALLWQTVGDLKNPAGNLALHIIGNLNHFICGVLGNSGYERDRDAEFELKDISRKDILVLLDQVKFQLALTLKNDSKIDMQAIYPLEVLDFPMSNEYFLIRLLGHMKYHLGQMNYLRQMLVPPKPAE